jgi:hypothetical protein
MSGALFTLPMNPFFREQACLLNSNRCLSISFKSSTTKPYGLCEAKTKAIKSQGLKPWLRLNRFDNQEASVDVLISLDFVLSI